MQLAKNEYLVMKSNNKYKFSINDIIETDFMSLYIHNKDTKEDRLIEDENINVNIKSYVYYKDMNDCILEENTLNKWQQKINAKNILQDVLSILLDELDNSIIYFEKIADIKELLNDSRLEFEIKDTIILDNSNDDYFNSTKILEYVFRKYTLALEIKINENPIRTEY